MKTTAFTKFHIELGARMLPFCGFNMPIEYSGINDEHMTVREKVGVFDVSHMGEFWVKGPKAFALVQKITSNNVAELYNGKVQYSCFPNGKGGIVDDLLVYKFDDLKYLLVVNAANIEKDWAWVTRNAKEMGMEIGKDVYNASDETAQLAVQGPLALKAMQKLTKANVVDMEYYTFQVCDFAGIKDVLFSTTGYTGSGGCEIYVDNKDADKLWKAVFEAGAEFGIKPIGLGARDTLRLESGFCLYGNDINDQTSAIEAGLGWITKFVDGNDFIDREKWEKIKNENSGDRLKGFVMIDRGIPRQHYLVYDAQNNEIGEVTSGTMSPILKQGVGMAYLKKGFWKEGTEIFIGIRDKKLKAKVTRPPFHESK
ncbi:MAG: glycine cleavage system protein T [Bacteroidetes bacterium GWC2_33_15]|nr:MAG: glycine cleavage system protein T [Bacteroidetes bacterium GWA2_33_15]OFX49660.1 MAG: glycine cleavage system protein T [Bacteroidetes bacterium GWC2_33_15]OFX65950.1 MAG: glycine cleavage system protein T [Bacteroidetes bacterium GWB2_32_14]OFX68289.1 MAG: glycine cleavage system protein T [Bacteroidetes bacterium GWD2_33_33]HAN18072.1 glycine cleavage system aminomethyltransferase GcvT [Bacteroidales bacterium]